jgi:hypothetical protein
MGSLNSHVLYPFKRLLQTCWWTECIDIYLALKHLLKYRVSSRLIILLVADR